MTDQNQPSYGAPQYGSAGQYAQQDRPDHGQGGPGYYEPAAVTRPPAMDKAVLMMRVGAGLAMLAAGINIALQGQIDDAMNKWVQDLTGQTGQQSSGGALSTILTGLIQMALWLWMAKVNGDGKSWGRTTATIFFVLSALSTAVSLAMPLPMLLKVAGILELAVGAAALFFMYQRESSRFYEAHRARI